VIAFCFAAAEGEGRGRDARAGGGGYCGQSAEFAPTLAQDGADSGARRLAALEIRPACRGVLEGRQLLGVIILRREALSKQNRLAA
jgi:hypothetical protein